MTRDDVIDVLTVVAAADRRTIGQADVEVWQAVIGDLPKDLAEQAVRDHLRHMPGVWLTPGHVYQGARAIRRDELSREPDEVREARQEALAAKALEDAAELAERKGIPSGTPSSSPATRKRINPLTERCPWCKAGIGTPCTTPGTDRVLRDYHPSRYDVAEARRNVT